MQIGNRFSYGLSQPIPHSHSRTPTNRFPFQQTSPPAPLPPRILRALLPPSGGPPRYSIFSLSFHFFFLSASFSSPSPPFVALSPGDLIFRRKSKRRMLRDRHRQFPPPVRKKTWKRIHIRTHTHTHTCIVPRRHRRHILILHTKRYALSLAIERVKYLSCNRENVVSQRGSFFRVPLYPIEKILDC